MLFSTTAKTVSIISSRYISHRQPLPKHLQKLLDRDKKKKTYKYPAAELTGNNKKKIPEGRQLRMHRISDVLYHDITQMIDNGEVDPEIATLGIQVSKVTVCPDFSAMNVYWQTTGTPQDEDIKSLLQTKAKKVRALLIEKKVMGKVPDVNFVADKTQERVTYINKLLAIADYGPDYIPGKSKEIPSHYVLPDITVSPKIASTVYNLSDLNKTNIKTSQSDKQEALHSAFRNDIYGLDHEALTNSILASKEKLRVAMKKRRKLSKAGESDETLSDFAEEGVLVKVGKNSDKKSVVKKKDLKADDFRILRKVESQPRDRRTQRIEDFRREAQKHAQLQDLEDEMYEWLREGDSFEVDDDLFDGSVDNYSESSAIQTRENFLHNKNLKAADFRMLRSLENLTDIDTDGGDEDVGDLCESEWSDSSDGKTIIKTVTACMEVSLSPHRRM